MNRELDIHTRGELVKFLQNIVVENEISTLVDKILSHPSGTTFIFVCRQFDRDLGHRQQVVRVFHNEGI